MIDETTRRHYRHLHYEQKISREEREPSIESFGRRRRRHHHHHHRRQSESANAGSDLDGHCDEQNVNGDAESGYGGTRVEAAENGGKKEAS